MPQRHSVNKQRKDARAARDGVDGAAADAREGRGISGVVSKLRNRAQEREAEFQEAHPSPEVQVTAAFASRNGASYAEVASEETKKKNVIRRISSQWWDRLLGAASERSFAEQAEQYAAHQTKRDYIFNTVGHTIWGFVFPLLTVVVTQLADVERAGMFSFAFVVGTLMMIAAQYGVRTYQVSDLDEEHSFADYQLNRVATVLLVVLVGYLFVRLRGYDGPMVQILAGVFAYRCIDALADCYEGRLQQMDKMYLAGISQMLRAIAGLVVFTAVLLVGKSVGAASIGMAIGAGATFVLITFPLALLETPKSRKLSFKSVGSLFKQCFPIFVALFLYAVVDNTPKFVMEATLPYDNQLYFNAMYFPAQAILLVVGLIYKPQLVRMAATWADPDRRKRFDIFIVVMLLGVVLITVAMVLFMKYAGITVLSILYGVDFEKFRTLCYMMIIAGGMTGAIDFLYQVITIMRRQELVTRSYLIAFAVGVVSSILLIHFGELEGAVTSYVLAMSVLSVALLWIYIAERINIARHPERDRALMLPAAGESTPANPALSGYGSHVAAGQTAANNSGDVAEKPVPTYSSRGAAEKPATGEIRRADGAYRPQPVEAGRVVQQRTASDAPSESATMRQAPVAGSAANTGRQRVVSAEGPTGVQTTRRLGHQKAEEDRKRANAAAVARSAILAEEISALDKILPTVDEDADVPKPRHAAKPETSAEVAAQGVGGSAGMAVDVPDSEYGIPPEGDSDGR